MIRSLQKIEHVQPNGATTLLLDFGDFIEEEIEFGAEQQTTGFAPIGAMWGIGTPDGGARRTFSYSVRRQHSSHSQARSWCLSHPSLIPFNKDGVLRISIRDAPDSDVEIWEIQSAVIQGCAARPLFDLKQTFRSLTTYQITGGQAIPIQGNFGQCYPIGWQTYVIGTDVSVIGDDECEVVPPYVPDPPTPGTPGHIVPEHGQDGIHLKITGSGLSLNPPIPSTLLSEKFHANGTTAFGKTQWETNPISGYFLIISNPPGETGDDWFILAATVAPGVDTVLSHSSTQAENPWDATFEGFEIEGVGTGTPGVEIA